MTAKRYQAKRPVPLLAPDGTANRTVATLDGVAMTMQAVSSSMLAAGAVTGRSTTTMIAASTASVSMKALADVVCDGVADEVEINAALTAIATYGGTVMLSEGTFTLAAPLTLSGIDQVLRGMGMGATTLLVVNAGGTPVNAAIVNVSGSWCEVSDLTVNGNRTNNGSASSMSCVTVTGARSPLIQRVRAINSTNYGFYIDTTVQNGIVRDCQSENHAGHGFVACAATGQPLVVSGCTAKGNGGPGFWAHGGPVAFSDCHSMSSNSWGYVIEADFAELNQCYARANPTGGFYVVGLRGHLIGCQAIGNAGRGIWVPGSGTQTIVEGCLVSGQTSGHSFESGSGDDTLFVGCLAYDAPSGYAAFRHDGNSKVEYIGCRAFNYITYGFLVTLGGEAHIRDCYAYGRISSYGIQIESGSNHVIDGCRILNNGGHGIIVTAAAVANIQITNNYISESSLAGAGTFDHINVAGTGAFIAGNVLRDGSGVRPGTGIRLASTATGAVLGQNDTVGAGVTVEGVVDSPTDSARHVVRLALEYVASTDLMVGTSIAANVWTDVAPEQSFRVDLSRSTVEILCFGSLFMQAATAGTSLQSRLVIDAAGSAIVKQLGCTLIETNNGWQSPLCGNGPMKLQNLATGTHTVKLQITANVASFGLLRAAAYPDLEFLTIQVLEYSR